MSVIPIASGSDFFLSGTPYALVFAFKYASLPPQNANQYPIFYMGDGGTGSGAYYLNLSYGPNPPGTGAPYGINYTGYNGTQVGRNQLISNPTAGTTYIVTVDFRYNSRMTVFTWNGSSAVQNNSANPQITPATVTKFYFGKSPSYSNNASFTLVQAAMFTKFVTGSDIPAQAVANIGALLATTNTPNTPPAPTYLDYSFGVTTDYNVAMFNVTGTSPVLTDGAGIQFTDTSSQQIDFTGYIPPLALPCFVKGTRILLASGYKTVETIQSGDLAITSDGRSVPVKTCSFRVENTSTKTAPYRISAGALGPNCPPTDLCVSPLHAVQDSRGIWQIPMFAARKNPLIKQYKVGKTVTYYHIECPNFFTDNIYAEGCITESFKNQQKPRGVIYTWNNTINGFVRFQKDKVEPIPRQSNCLMIHG
jgi:Hint domain